jgi:hypothetical protein
MKVYGFSDLELEIARTRIVLSLRDRALRRRRDAQRIFQKLGIRDRIELTCYALKTGLVTVHDYLKVTRASSAEE